jgi:WXG100 family type VII secretion target
MRISVNHRALETAAQDMVAKARQAKDVLDRLDQDVRSDVLAWGGRAKDAYLPAKQQWDTSMLAMLDHLQQAAVSVDSSNAEYLRTDRANAGLFDAIAKR